MLSNVAKTAPKSLDLIIDTPDFFDFANVDRALILPRMSIQELSALEMDQTMEPSEYSLGRVYSRDDLTMRAKQLSIAKGFKLQTVACRSESKMIFTCTKSGRSYFHKTARPEDKVYCPFMISYQQFFKSSCQTRE